MRSRSLRQVRLYESLWPKLRTLAFTKSEMGNCWRVGASGYHGMACYKIAGAAVLRIPEGQGKGLVKTP